MRNFILPSLIAVVIGTSLGLTSCATSSTGTRGESSPASNATDTRQIAPGVKSNINRTGTGGG